MKDFRRLLALSYVVIQIVFCFFGTVSVPLLVIGFLFFFAMGICACFPSLGRINSDPLICGPDKEALTIVLAINMVSFCFDCCPSSILGPEWTIPMIWIFQLINVFYVFGILWEFLRGHSGAGIMVKDFFTAN